jgi:hypothetical protein
MSDNYFAVAPSCPVPSDMITLQDCNDVSCGEYCVANGTLPDGNSNTTVDNCVAGGRNVSVYIHLCGGTTPAPTSEPAWHETRHAVFGCIEVGVNITSSTFSSFETNSGSDAASLECLAKCQSTAACEF